MRRKPNTQQIVCKYYSWRLFQRDGVFYADGRSRKINLGKHSLGTRDREQAFSNLDSLDLKKAIELGIAEVTKPAEIESISIIDGWTLYIEYCGRAGVLGGVSKGTLKRYRAVRNKHVTFCSRHCLELWESFNKKHLEKYGNWLSKRFSDRTVYFELTLLKSVINWLIDNQKLSADCSLKYPLSKPQGTDTYCYSKIEVTAMVKYCQANQDLKWLENVIITLSHTGMRISELAGLKWSDVDLESKTIRVADERSSRRKIKSGTARTTKGRRSRTIPVHPELERLLTTLKCKPGNRVLHAMRGGQLRPNNVLHTFIRDVIEPLKEQFPISQGEIGFEHGRLHSFRHFFCSQAFLGGASEGEIKEWLGHANSKMVEHYRHLKNEDSQRKMKRIDFLNTKKDDDEQSKDVA